MVGMYAWPPKPGLTVITSTWSTRSRTFSIISAGLTDLAERAVEVDVRLDVRDDDARLAVRALGRLGVLVEHGLAVVVRHHKLRLEHDLRVLAARANHLRAEGEVRHEVAVHDVKLDAVDASVLEALAVVAHVGPVGRKHRRDDLDRARLAVEHRSGGRARRQLRGEAAVERVTESGGGESVEH